MKQPDGWLWRLSLANLLFLYGPIAVLILFSFNASRLSATWQGWSLRWYRALWTNQALLDAAANSLWVAMVSTILALLLGVGLAIGLEGLPGRRQRQVEQAKGHLRICGLGPILQDTFRIGHFDRLFAIYDDLKSAIGSL